MSQRTITILSISLFVGLLTWGVFSMIVFFGVPAHNLPFLTDVQAQSLQSACTQGGETARNFCRGIESLPYIFESLWRTTGPIHGYIIFSLVIYGFLIGYAGFNTGQFRLEFRLRPWHIIGGFVLSVWLFASFFALGSTGQGEDPTKFNIFYEPAEGVYRGIGAEGLSVLNENYQDLLDRGCLRDAGTTNIGTRAYTMSFFCMQQAFWVRAGAQILLTAILLFNFLILGRLALNWLKLPIRSGLLETVFSLGLGSFVWVVLLWILGRVGLLTPLLSNIVFFGLPIAAFPISKYWLRAAKDRSVYIGEKYSHVPTILLWLLISYLALNFLVVVRPFPIGWDDLGRYLNFPRLMASYGSIIPGLSKFNWEYLSAMAYGMFGYESSIGATFAMMTHWVAGALSVLAVYAFGRTFLGARAGILSAVLYYLLPMVGHFSFADMKIDNAVFFTSTISTLAIFLYLFSTVDFEEEEEKGNTRWLILAGILAGFSFAIKPTAVLGILLSLNVLIGALLGPMGFTAMTLAGFGILTGQGTFDVSAIAERLGFALTASHGTVKLFATLFFLSGAGIIGALLLKKMPKLTKSAVIGSLIFGVSIIATSVVWMFNNLISYDDFQLKINNALNHNETLATQFYYYTEDALEEQSIDASNARYLPDELGLDINHPQCKIDSSAEELDRYWGFSDGWSHYTTLPWRLVMNSDQSGYYVTLMPILLALPLVLLLPYFWRKEGRWLRLLFAGSMVFLVQWIFVGNGIPWYGLGMFIGFVITLEAMQKRAPDTMNRVMLGILITGSIIAAILLRMWQFDQQRNLLEYPLGKSTPAVMREVTVPYYNNVRDDVVERHNEFPDQPYTFRIGTFIPYFIPRNPEIIPLADNQASFFNCINQERDHALTLQRLKSLGFNSLIFDTNTATIEKNPQGTLHQKINALLNFLNDPTLNLDIVINDSNAGIVYVRFP